MPLKPRRHPGELFDRLDIRLSQGMLDRVREAIPYTPGAASCSGVARVAIDRYLSEVLADSAA